ncbi:recombinase family protein [Micromonospora noduli]|uniref:recombinase family protein n=1 Tax=Micromonospora noduli TaxID=709876 RepID=UPI00124B1BA2|nr:recombinase family protein [Micromonospora noduli]KAB1925141.1 recombinase family protein [Micromonospora noduli]
MTRRAAKYRRISDDREGRELGIGRQDEDLDALGERADLVYVASYVDNDIGASTKSTKRRNDYERMLADAKAGHFEVIAAYTTGRLTRRPREHEDLIDLAVDHRIEFEYVRSPSFDLNTAQGRRIARTLAAQDAGETEEMSERVARDALRRAQQGLNHGGRRCYGYAANGLDVNHDEVQVIRDAAAAIIGGVPLGRIVRDLNTAGVRTVNGKLWAPGTLRDLLKRPRLAGLSVHRGEVIGKGQWPAIITADQHATITALFADPTRRTTTGNRAAYLLSGIAVCGKCGNSITSFGLKKSKPGEPPSTRHLYRCRKGACVARRRDWCDQWVTDNVLERLSRPDARDLLIDTTRPDLKGLRAESEALRVQLDEFAEDRANNLITRAQMLAGTERVRVRLTDIDAALLHVDRAPVLADLIEAPDPATVWDSLDLDRRRAVVKTLMTVTLHPGGSGKRTFDPSRVQITWTA